MVPFLVFLLVLVACTFLWPDVNPPFGGTKTKKNSKKYLQNFVILPAVVATTLSLSVRAFAEESVSLSLKESEVKAMAEFVEECAAQNLMRDNFRDHLVKCREEKENLTRSYERQAWIKNTLWFLVGLSVGKAVDR